jgi:hypothetical protein
MALLNISHIHINDHKFYGQLENAIDNDALQYLFNLFTERNITVPLQPPHNIIKDISKEEGRSIVIDFLISQYLVDTQYEKFALCPTNIRIAYQNFLKSRVNDERKLKYMMGKSLTQLSSELIPILGIPKEIHHGGSQFNLSYKNVYNGLTEISKYMTKQQLDKAITDVQSGYFDGNENENEGVKMKNWEIKYTESQSKNAELEAKIMELQARLLMLEPKEEIVEEKPKKKKKVIINDLFEEMKDTVTVEKTKAEKPKKKYPYTKEQDKIRNKQGRKCVAKMIDDCEDFDETDGY